MVGAEQVKAAEFLQHRRTWIAFFGHSPTFMATPIIVGVGAITAALVGRQLVRSGLIGGKREWAKGGFRAKMDRKEAVAILGLKCAHPTHALLQNTNMVCILTEMAQG
jgi:hypothetical protein